MFVLVEGRQVSFLAKGKCVSKGTYMNIRMSLEEILTKTFCL